MKIAQYHNKRRIGKPCSTRMDLSLYIYIGDAENIEEAIYRCRGFLPSINDFRRDISHKRSGNANRNTLRQLWCHRRHFPVIQESLMFHRSPALLHLF